MNPRRARFHYFITKSSAIALFNPGAIQKQNYCNYFESFECNGSCPHINTQIHTQIIHPLLRYELHIMARVFPLNSNSGTHMCTNHSCTEGTEFNPSTDGIEDTNANCQCDLICQITGFPIKLVTMQLHECLYPTLIPIAT